MQRRRIAPLTVVAILLLVASAASPAEARWWRRKPKPKPTPAQTLVKLTQHARAAINGAQSHHAMVRRLSRHRTNNSALHVQVDNYGFVGKFNNAARHVEAAVKHAQKHGLLTDASTVRELDQLVKTAYKLGGPSTHRLRNLNAITTELYVQPLVNEGTRLERSLVKLAGQLNATTPR